MNIASEEEKPAVSNWWHRKLADFFETAENIDRLVEVGLASDKDCFVHV